MLALCKIPDQLEALSCSAFRAMDVGETINNHGFTSGCAGTRNSGPPLSIRTPQIQNGMIRTILVVDDEPQMRRVLRTTLIARDYKVIEAGSGEDALKKFSGEPCDCILLDLNLPGMNGIDTCRAIRKSSGVPVIIVSIRDSEKDHVAAREAGADDYVTKPFGLDDLLSRIQTIRQGKL